MKQLLRSSASLASFCERKSLNVSIIIPNMMLRSTIITSKKNKKSTSHLETVRPVRVDGALAIGIMKSPIPVRIGEKIQNEKMN